ATNSTASSLPPTSFVESDFVALFEPAGKVQGPKMRAAIRSLRLAMLNPALATNGVISKHDRPKRPVIDAETDPRFAAKLDDPRQPFDVTKLVQQIEQECVWPNGGSQKSPDNSRWGGADEGSYSNCLALFARISGILTSQAFDCVFGSHQKPSLTRSI